MTLLPTKVNHEYLAFSFISQLKISALDQFPGLDKLLCFTGRQRGPLLEDVAEICLGFL